MQIGEGHTRSVVLDDQASGRLVVADLDRGFRVRLRIGEKIGGGCAKSIRIHVQERITFDEGHPSIAFRSRKQRSKRYPAAILVADRHVVLSRQGEQPRNKASSPIDGSLDLLQRTASNGRVRRRRRNLRLDAQACQRRT